MKTYTLDEIREQTLSTGATCGTNAVYETIAETTAVGSEDGTLQTIKMKDIPKGSKFIISGCGTLDEKNGTSLFLIGDIWMRIDNRAVKHVGNEILIPYESAPYYL